MIVKNLIGNRDVLPTSGATFEHRSPVTGDIVTEAAASSVADVKAAIESSAAAFATWSQTGPNERRNYLLDAAKALELRLPDFTAAMQNEIGATAGWAAFNVKLAVEIMKEAASLTTQIQGDIIPSDRPGSLAMAVRQPAGVCLGIAPWNAPVILGVRAIALPIACGNTALLKASEVCPMTHQLIGAAMRDAGLPDGVVNVVHNAPTDGAEIVASLIAHDSVRRINFTGSTRVGRIIGKQAAEHLKPAILELGGKAPMIVLDDADMEQAVNAAVFGAFMNQGQICMSTERLIVYDDIADAFIEAFVRKTKSLPVGDPSGKVVFGAVASQDTVARLQTLKADAMEKGASLVAGGEITGTIIDPQILDNVTPDMSVYYEESFGPMVSIIRVPDDEAAIRVANDTQYGLTASVFSRDIARALVIANQIQSGMCHINGPTVHDEAQMPFGGMKASGYGRFGGQAGIAEFTELRWISLETQAVHYPF